MSCKHKWHFVRIYESDFVSRHYTKINDEGFVALFVCEKCGLLKRIKVKEKIKGDDEK